MNRAETGAMDKPAPSPAQQVAQAVIAFERERTGRTPTSVAVVLSEDLLVVTLHGVLTPAERALAQTTVGAAQVQEFHRQVFTSSSEPLRQEIKRITGAQVREAAVELEPSSGTVVHVFTSGAVVQVFLLAHGVPGGSWSGSGASIQS